MLLSDKDLKAKLISEEIVITSPNDDHEENINSSSIDLRLGHHFRIFKHREQSILDPKDSTSFKNSTELITLQEPNKGIILQAGELIIGVSIERIKLSNHICGRLLNRSSYERIGLNINSGGLVNAGFEGTLSLTIQNNNKLPIIIYPGDRICQLAFEILSSTSNTPYFLKPGAKYQGQELPQVSLLDEDTKV